MSVSRSFIAKIVFVVAMAFTLTVPLVGAANACDPEVIGHC
jgi:hypothetical protein